MTQKWISKLISAFRKIQAHARDKLSRVLFRYIKNLPAGTIYVQQGGFKSD